MGQATSPAGDIGSGPGWFGGPLDQCGGPRQRSAQFHHEQADNRGNEMAPDEGARLRRIRFGRAQDQDDGSCERKPKSPKAARAPAPAVVLMKERLGIISVLHAAN